MDFQGVLTPADFTAHVLVHLLDDADTINVKFLMQRVPEEILTKDAGLKQVCDATIALTKSQYEVALGLLDKPIPGKAGQNTTINAQEIEALRNVLIWHLRTHTVPAVVRKGYSSIELSRVKSMLGASKFSATDFTKLLNANGLLESEKPDSKGFVTVKSQGISQNVFSLTPERV